MESPTIIISSEEFEDSLSFCDLPLHNQVSQQQQQQQQQEPIFTSLDDQEQPQPLPSSDDDDDDDGDNDREVFEFFKSPNSRSHGATVESFIFCGRIIPQKTHQHSLNPTASPAPSSLLFNKSSRCSKSVHFQANKKQSSSSPMGTLRRHQSGSGRKHTVLIGLAKIPERMELGDIKRRQSRQAPKPVFPPASSDGRKWVVDGVNGGGGGNGEILFIPKPSRCRDYVASALARCIPFLRNYA